MKEVELGVFESRVKTIRKHDQKRCPVCKHTEFKEIIASANAYSDNDHLSICLNCGIVNGLKELKWIKASKENRTRSVKKQIKKLQEELNES